MGSIIQGALGFIGGRQQLETQQEDFLSNQQFSAGQAALNRQFQAGQQLQAEDYNTMMSDTAMQRRVADLKAAGLNPLLAVGAGGASAPQMSGMPGSVGSAPGQPNVPNPFAEGTAAYNSAMVANAQRDQLEAQAKKTTSETPSRRASAIDPDTGEVVVDADPGHELGNAALDNLKSMTNTNVQQATQIKTNIDFIKTQIEGQGLQNAGQSILNFLQGQNAEVLSRTKDALVQLSNSDATIRGLEAQAAQAKKWVQTGDIGTVLSFIQTALGIASQGASIGRQFTPIGVGVNSAQRLLNVRGSSPFGGTP